MLVVLNSKSQSWNPVERLIFPAPAASYSIESFPEELILVPRDDGEKVPCIFLPFKHARFLVIYFHANAEDLGLCYSFCKIMHDLFQVHVLAVEYPGYGICSGTTTEAGITANAAAAMRFATETLKWPCDGIKLFGRSLGTGPCVQLAARYNVAGMILVSPFTSIGNLFRTQIGPLADFIVEDRFRTCDYAPAVSSPTLIIHGQQDTLIPLEHGKAIYDLLTSRKMMVCPADMAHNTSLLKSIGTFVLPMTQFFSLPDYTFEDIEVPPWVFPGKQAIAANGRDESGVEDRVSEAAARAAAAAERSRRVQHSPKGDNGDGPAGSDGASTGLAPTPVPRLGLSAIQRNGGNEIAEAYRARAPYPSPRTPRAQGEAVRPGEVKASRNYAFSPMPEKQFSTMGDRQQVCEPSTGWDEAADAFRRRPLPRGAPRTHGLLFIIAAVLAARPRASLQLGRQGRLGRHGEQDFLDGRVHPHAA